MHLKFVNGQERKYDMGRSTFDAIQTEISYINDLVEFERSMNGQDDELDDEAWVWASLNTKYLNSLILQTEKGPV